MGIEFEGAAICGDGFIRLASPPQRVAQIIVGFRVVGLDLDCAAMRGDGFLKAAQILERDAQIVVRLRQAGLDPLGLHGCRADRWPELV